jgi:hypothetical protein
MSADPILSTLSNLVSLYDGITEPETDHAMTVLLPAKIAKQLKLPETATIATQANIPNSLFVTYHSELIQQFTKLLGAQGSVSTIRVQYPGHIKTSGFEKQLLQTLCPQNGLIRFLEAKPATTRYLYCHVTYTAEADEKRMGIVSFIINETTKVTPIGIGDALFWKADRLPVEDPQAVSEAFLADFSQAIESTAARQIAANIENWRLKLDRAKARDEERLKTYYGTMIQEIQRRSRSEAGRLRQSRDAEDGDNLRELERITATAGELDRKLADLQERYALKVDASLYSVLIIELPTIHLQCELVRKKVKRHVTAIWNPFTKVVEPLCCERTGIPVREFYLDDSTAQIVSPTAWQQK